MTDDDALLSVVREQNRDMREMAKDLSTIASQVARHDEQARLRPQIVAEGHDRMDQLEKRILMLETVSWKPLLAIVAGVLTVFVISLYLVAGGNPEGVKELLP